MSAGTVFEPKLYRHRCGCLIWSRVHTVIDDMVVVEYRGGAPGTPGIVTYHCPQCRQALRLWWDDPDGKVRAAWRERQEARGAVDK